MVFPEVTRNHEEVFIDFVDNLCFYNAVCRKQYCPCFPAALLPEALTGEHDGHMGNHGVIGDRAAFFPQPQVGLAHLEEHFDAPAFPIQPHDLFLAQFHVRRN